MMKLLINFEISKSYAEWKAVFDEHKAARDAANIKDVFVGVEAANPHRVHLMFEVADMATMQAFMQSPENAATIEKAGHIVESTVMVPLAE
jgi:antibiotic biosynthesis monooxygenase (ABM) superfamily enzyme